MCLRSIKSGKWLTPAIPVLGRLRQEDREFKAGLGYVARSCLKKKVVNMIYAVSC
jgi:hypothetical protein